MLPLARSLAEAIEDEDTGGGAKASDAAGEGEAGASDVANEENARMMDAASEE
jgi:hypothetical protein